MTEKDLPRPGLDDEDEDTNSTESTDGPGSVTVDEPTKPALNPEKGDM